MAGRSQPGRWNILLTWLLGIGLGLMVGALLAQLLHGWAA